MSELKIIGNTLSTWDYPDGSGLGVFNLLETGTRVIEGEFTGHRQYVGYAVFDATLDLFNDLGWQYEYKDPINDKNFGSVTAVSRWNATGQICGGSPYLMPYPVATIDYNNIPFNVITRDAEEQYGNIVIGWEVDDPVKPTWYTAHIDISKASHISNYNFGLTFYDSFVAEGGVYFTLNGVKPSASTRITSSDVIGLHIDNGALHYNIVESLPRSLTLPNKLHISYSTRGSGSFTGLCVAQNGIPLINPDVNIARNIILTE